MVRSIRKEIPVKIQSSSPTAEMIARHLARNEQTWETLVRLGVHDGAELELAFAFGTAGPEGDRELAKFLQRETEYEIEIESEGVAGQTPPMRASRAALDEWVRKMVLVGHEHGGCSFDGWTTTIAVGGS
jgi:hypothetical protein